MKYIILAALVILAQTLAFQDAQGANLEVSLGVTQFGQVENGVWYQNEFPHTLDLRSASASIGATGYISDWLRYHAGYMYLGQANSSAVAVGDDNIYAKYRGQSGTVMPLWHWNGKGEVQELYFTLAPEWVKDGYTLAIEAGLALQRPTWEIRIPDVKKCFTCETFPFGVTHNPRLQIGHIFGASIKRGQNSVVLSMHSAQANGDRVPGIYFGYATNLSLRHEF